MALCGQVTKGCEVGCGAVCEVLAYVSGSEEGVGVGFGGAEVDAARDCNGAQPDFVVARAVGAVGCETVLGGGGGVAGYLLE